MATLNGLDYYPEDFFAVKKRKFQEEEDHLVKQVAIEIDNQELSQRYMLQEGNFNTISQVQPGEELPAPNHRELLRQLQLIPEDSLELQGSSMGISQEMALHGSLLVPSFISRQRPPIQV